MQKNKHDDDDGRTVADMSGIDSPSLFGRLPKKKTSRSDADATDGGSTDKPWEADKDMLSRGERRAYIFTALLSGIGIWAVFTAVFALIIFIMTR